MTTTTCYGSADDGFITDGTSVSTTTNLKVGQETTFGTANYEAFIDPDTSSIPDTDTVSAATLSLWLVTDSSTSRDFTVNARLKDWGTSLDTGDWTAPGGTFPTPLLATIGTNGIGATGAYKDLTSESAFPSNVSKTGETRIGLYSSDTEANSGGGGTQYVIWDDADTAGTTQDPKITVTHQGVGEDIVVLALPMGTVV